jgi:hypothetical protein
MCCVLLILFHSILVFYQEFIKVNNLAFRQREARQHDTTDGNSAEGQMQIKFKRFDGSTAQSKRQEMVNTFNKSNNEDVMLISTKAGGLGI